MINESVLPGVILGLAFLSSRQFMFHNQITLGCTHSRTKARSVELIHGGSPKWILNYMGSALLAQAADVCSSMCCCCCCCC
eukprot:5380084-Amphidinium_carterae.1